MLAFQHLGGDIRLGALYWDKRAQYYQHILDKIEQIGTVHDHLGRNLGYSPTEREQFFSYHQEIQTAQAKKAALLEDFEPLSLDEYSDFIRATLPIMTDK